MLAAGGGGGGGAPRGNKYHTTQPRAQHGWGAGGWGPRGGGGGGAPSKDTPMMWRHWESGFRSQALAHTSREAQQRPAACQQATSPAPYPSIYTAWRMGGGMGGVRVCVRGRGDVPAIFSHKTDGWRAVTHCSRQEAGGEGASRRPPLPPHAILPATADIISARSVQAREAQTSDFTAGSPPKQPMVRFWLGGWVICGASDFWGKKPGAGGTLETSPHVSHVTAALAPALPAQNFPTPASHSHRVGKDSAPTTRSSDWSRTSKSQPQRPRPVATQNRQHLAPDGALSAGLHAAPAARRPTATTRAEAPASAPTTTAQTITEAAATAAAVPRAAATAAAITKAATTATRRPKTAAAAAATAKSVTKAATPATHEAAAPPATPVPTTTPASTPAPVNTTGSYAQWCSQRAYAHMQAQVSTGGEHGCGQARTQTHTHSREKNHCQVYTEHHPVLPRKQAVGTRSPRHMRQR
jgi:hypothetical protein